jgi:tripartite-type tricarboxylate transporter receptor subunit TctC
MQCRQEGDVTTLFRRAWSTCLLLPLILSPAYARAQPAWPVKPIRMVIAAPTGTGPELIARQLAAQLSEAFRQPVVIDSRPGATGLIGAEIVARSAPDGYTLWFITSTQLLGTTLYGRFPLAKDYTPVAMLSSTAFGIAVNASLPVHSVPELLAHAKARPGKLLYGSNGQGATTHLCMELINGPAGVKMVHVPYKGGTLALADLAAGDLQVSCQPLPTLPQFARAGRLRVIGVTSLKRSPMAPEVPAVAETIPGFEILGWHGLLAPLRTPQAIVDRVNAEATRIMLTTDMRERLAALGVEPAPSSPAEFGARLVAETAKWTAVMKDANIRPTD